MTRLALKSVRWKNRCFACLGHLVLHHVSLCLQLKLSGLYFQWESKLRYSQNHMIQEAGALKKSTIAELRVSWSELATQHLFGFCLH